MPSPPNTEAAVVVRRGAAIESWHAVSFAVADAAGTRIAVGGDAERAVFPRSAIKPLQALALVASGAADRFALGSEELALACASHSGETEHVRRVHAWLERLGLDETALECGAHLPTSEAAARGLMAAGATPTAVHNNCSGKHAGMLTLARHLAVDPTGYIHPDHPVQRRIAAELAAMTDGSVLPVPAIDGCGVPTYPIPLADLAVALARFADPSDLDAARADACRRLQAAMTAHPHLVAGSGRTCTRIMTQAPKVVVKTGAEGVYAAALPTRGLGIALKVADGAGRAASVALLALLDGLGALDAGARAALATIARPTLRNHAGTVVGSIEPAAGWPVLDPAL